MRAYDIILKKRDGSELSEKEMEFFINGAVSGEIPDYQTAAFLMAVWFSGMTERETFLFTKAMAASGETLDLSEIGGIKVDKHSSGGVGDKTTLVVAPIAASLGVKVPKMAGRSLGYTGGTIDKLESIPGFNVKLSKQQFVETVRTVGACVISQTGDIAPADKLFYSLRDATATVDSAALIASSVMSKKLASGVDAILLDVKAGAGAFMKTPEEAEKLAKLMIAIGKTAGKKTAAAITDMNAPLGRAIGNSLEVIEAAETLKGRGPADLTKLCVTLSGIMLFLADKGTAENCSAWRNRLYQTEPRLKNSKK